MKVLHLIGGGDEGGAKVHVLSLVKELSKNIDVRILCFRQGNFLDEAINAGIDVQVVRTGNVFKDIKKVIDIIKLGNYEIIHSHGAKANMISVITKFFIRLPRLVTVHSDYQLDYLQSFKKRITFGVINAIALRFMDFYVAVSNSFKNMLIDRHFNRYKIFTLYNGVDFNRNFPLVSKDNFATKYNIDIKADDIIVGLLARLHPVKDISTFIYAAKEVLKKYKSTKFIIAGEGDERKRLEKLISILGLESNVFLIGHINDPYEFMSIIDINVLTSISESFPYSILEGTIFKKATISSNVGGITDLIDHGENGFLINPGEYEKLSEYIIKLIGEPELMIKIGEKIFEKSKCIFSLENMSKTQIDIYKAIIKESKNSFKYDVIISGYYGFNNIGDDSILMSIISNLKSLRKDIKILVLSYNPSDTSKIYNVDSISRLNIVKIIALMRKSKVFINGGGSLIQDDSSTRSLVYYLFLIWLAKINRMKVMLYANGIGQLKKGINRKMTSKILNLIEVITLRDELSLNELKSLSVNKPKIILTADPAMNVEAIGSQEVENIFKIEKIDYDRLFIGFSVKKCSDDKYEEVIAELADYAVETYGLLPLFIPMHRSIDLVTIENIISKMKNKGYVLKNQYSDGEIIGILKKVKVLVGMRLHALIFSVINNIPVIGIDHDVKIKAFMDYINKGYSCCINNLKASELKSLLDDTILNYDSIKSDLRQNFENLKQKALDNAKIAIDLIDHFNKEQKNEG